MAAIAAVKGFVRSPVTQTIGALGLAQIISWGSSLYALGVLGKPIAAETGWSQTLLFGGLSIGLLTSSVISAWIGRLIDMRGGRNVMALGSLLLGLGLASLSQVTTPVAYLATWAFLGIGMRMTLYDAAFPSIVQALPTEGRRAISYLTLYGGFASSAFWPLGHALNNAYGWRTALLVFAAINLFMTIPLTLFALGGRSHQAPASAEPAAAAAPAQSALPPLEGAPRVVAMVLFGLVSALTAVVFGAMAVQLVPILEATGLAAGTAVFLASLKGFAQVAGRIWDLFLARHWHALDVGRVSIGLLPAAFALLMLADGSTLLAFGFILLFGVANGLVTIIRGAVPLALFGSKGYGVVLGILATPYLVLAALSPTVFALVVERWGYGASEVMLLVAGLCAYLVMEALTFWYRRREKAYVAAP